MSNVSLTIGGRVFTVACADGEEAHVAQLGRMIHDKVTTMAEASSQSDLRMLLFAALLLADEVSDLRAQAADGETGQSADPVDARRVENIAMRLEKLADRLEA